MIWLYQPGSFNKDGRKRRRPPFENEEVGCRHSVVQPYFQASRLKFETNKTDERMDMFLMLLPCLIACLELNIASFNLLLNIGSLKWFATHDSDK